MQRPQPLSVWEDWAAFSEQQYAALVRVHSNTRRLMLHQKRIRATVVLQSFARMWLVRAPMVNKIDTPAKRAQLLRFNSSLTDLYKKESQYASALENVIGVRVSICASRLYATLDRKSLIDIDCSLSLSLFCTLNHDRTTNFHCVFKATASASRPKTKYCCSATLMRCSRSIEPLVSRSIACCHDGRSQPGLARYGNRFEPLGIAASTRSLRHSSFSP